MTLVFPMVVRAENKLGKAMNEIRAWLDSEGIEPVQFKAIVGGDGVGFEISFRHEREADRFQERFAEYVSNFE